MHFYIVANAIQASERIRFCGSEEAIKCIMVMCGCVHVCARGLKLQFYANNCVYALAEDRYIWCFFRNRNAECGIPFPFSTSQDSESTERWLRCNCFPWQPQIVGIVPVNFSHTENVIIFSISSEWIPVVTALEIACYCQWIGIDCFFLGSNRGNRLICNSQFTYARMRMREYAAEREREKIGGSVAHSVCWHVDKYLWKFSRNLFHPSWFYPNYHSHSWCVRMWVGVWHIALIIL